MRRGPDFIILGAMKCGTSTLHEQLALQPGCFMSQPKEPCFFSDDDQFERGLDWYESLFEAAPDGALCGESSTHYTKLPTYPRTVERMREHLPAAKLIYVMRHPLDRLVSHYIHEWTQRQIKGTFEQALDQHRELVEYGLYAMQLRPYLEAFGPHNLLPVFFEQQTSDPQRGLERVCRFIGYRGRPAWNPGLGAQNVSKDRMRKSPARDAVVDAPILRTVRRRLVPQSVRDRVKRFWTMAERPHLTAAKRAELEAIFDRDLAELARWLGRDLTCKSFGRLAREPAPEWSKEAGELAK